VNVLVIDASIAVAIVRREPARDVIRRLLRERGRPSVPEFFWLEVINSLARRHHYTSAEILEAIRELEELGIETIETDAFGRLIVIDLVERHGLTAYDATYLALAESADAELLTTDRQLAAAAGARAILVEPRGRLAEPPAPYEVEPTWPTWRGAAAYLGELRRRVAEGTAARA
jgi:predicted nucleic acid-binding protein